MSDALRRQRTTSQVRPPAAPRDLSSASRFVGEGLRAAAEAGALLSALQERGDYLEKQKESSWGGPSWERYFFKIAGEQQALRLSGADQGSGDVRGVLLYYGSELVRPPPPAARHPRLLADRPRARRPAPTRRRRWARCHRW